MRDQFEARGGRDDWFADVPQAVQDEVLAFLKVHGGEVSGYLFRFAHHPAMMLVRWPRSLQSALFEAADPKATVIRGVLVPGQCEILTGATDEQRQLAEVRLYNVRGDYRVCSGTEFDECSKRTLTWSPYTGWDPKWGYLNPFDPNRALDVVHALDARRRDSLQ
jgi:hypothetical protein